jgi:hypothetical protein
MSLTAKNAQVYKGTAAVTYGSGSGVSNRELQGTATITYGGAPTSNTALSLPGTSGAYMNLGTSHPANFDLATNNLFVECWVYFNSLSTQYQCIVADGPTGSGASQECWIISINPSNAVDFKINAPAVKIATSSTILTVGVWYHVAASYNSGSSTGYIFINGGTPNSVATVTPKTSTGASITLGAYPSPSSAVYMNGYIRDLRVVQGGIVPTTSFTPAQAPFRLNVPSYITGGSTVLSLAEQYFNPSWLNLPGTSGSYMTLGTNNPSNFDTSATNFFVECWVYLKSIPASSTVQYIILRGTGVYGAEDIGLRIMPTGFAQFYSYGAGNTIAIPDTGVALSVNTWYHLAGSINSSTKTVYVFLNGVLKNSQSMAGAPRTTTGSNFFIGTPTIVIDWVATNAYIQDLRVTRGGTVPTTTFTPAAAPFGLASPSYVSGGTTVLSLATQYYQTGMTIKTNNSPDIYLAPTGSYPTFNSTGGTAPTFLSDRVRFNPGAVLSTSPSCQYVDFGPQIFPMTTSGFSFAVRFQFTGTAGAWERIFSINPGGTNPVFEFFRNSNTNILIMGYFNPSQNEVAHYGSYAQNTTYTVIGVYDPNAGTFGTLYYYFNGTLGATYATTAKLANFTSTNTYIGTSKDGAAALNADIFYAAMYKRVLSASEITAITASGPSFGPTPIQFTSRPILPAVLVNPGAQSFTNGGTVTVAQTALEPANGITWTLAPTGQGVSVASSTDYALTLSTPTAVTQNLFTVSATNKAGLTTVTQFTGATPIFNRISSGAAASVVGIYSLRALRSLYSRVVQIRSSGFVYPPIAMTSDNFTATGSYNGVTNGIYISSASSAWGGSEFPFSAFDKNFNASRWTTSSSPYNGTTGAYGGGFSTTISGSAYSGEWLQLRVPSATVITSYTIYTSSFDPQRTPVDFKVAGSNDGTTWTVIDTQTGITSWLSSSTSLTFTVTSGPPAYIYFRLVTNKNGGTGSNGYLSIGEWVINNIPANTDFYADTLGNLTTAAGSGQTLSSWLGGATGYVTTLYDQTSNGYNLSQATTANQPAINLTTTPYSMIFNGSSTWIYNSSVPFNFGAGSFTLRYVVSNNSGGCVLFKAIGTAFTWATPYEKKFWLGDGTTNEGSSGNYPSHVGNSEDYVVSSTVITAGAKNSIVHKATARTVVPIYVNGNTASLSRNSINMQNDAGNYFILGRGGGSAYYNGNLFELELFSTPLSDADRVILDM